MVTQTQGVYDAVVAFTKENNISFGSETKLELTSSQIKEVATMVRDAMLAGEISISNAARAKYDTDEKLFSYCGSLVRDRLRKDTRFTAGVVYSPANPGSRKGNSDAVLRELKKCYKRATTDEQREAVDIEIQKRLEAITQEKTQKININYDILPENLKNLISQES